MARRSVGKPRFYADILQYIKTIGKYDSSTHPELFNLNPSNNQEYVLHDSATDTYTFKINSEDGTGGAVSQLLSVDGNIYYGILGHNFDNKDVVWGVKYKKESGGWSSPLVDSSSTFYNGSSDSSNVYTKPIYDGYSIVIPTSSDADASGKEIRWQVKNNETSLSYIRLGAFTFGRYYEPEHSFELSAKVTYSQEGIKKQKTVDGSTLTNINNLGVPNWGNQPAWTLQKIDDRDYATVANRARRQWEVGLSFISDDGLFDKAGNSNKFFTYDEDEDKYNFDTSLSSFFKLSHMGSLPFIFCPDSKATRIEDGIEVSNLEFAICRITNQPSFKQVANNTFSTSLVLTETY